MFSPTSVISQLDPGVLGVLFHLYLLIPDITLKVQLYFFWFLLESSTLLCLIYYYLPLNNISDGFSLSTFLLFILCSGLPFFPLVPGLHLSLTMPCSFVKSELIACILGITLIYLLTFTSKAVAVQGVRNSFLTVIHPLESLKKISAHGHTFFFLSLPCWNTKRLYICLGGQCPSPSCHKF